MDGTPLHICISQHRICHIREVQLIITYCINESTNHRNLPFPTLFLHGMALSYPISNTTILPGLGPGQTPVGKPLILLCHLTSFSPSFYAICCLHCIIKCFVSQPISPLTLFSDTLIIQNKAQILCRKIICLVLLCHLYIMHNYS